MCIIMFKPKGVEMPDEQTIINCFENNPHGAGFMYQTKKGMVRIKKGLMTVDSLLDELKKLKNKKDLNLAVHFRWATHGKTTEGQTHPFPITGRISVMEKTDLTTCSAMMHNGICSDYGDRCISDTMDFVKKHHIELVSHIKNTHGKFLVMTGDEIGIYGSFEVYGGCLYSNNGYQNIVKYARFDNFDYYDYNFREAGHRSENDWCDSCGVEVKRKDLFELNGFLVCEDCANTFYVDLEESELGER